MNVWIIHYWLITSNEANIQNKPSFLPKNIRDQSGYVQRQQALFNESPDVARTYYEGRKNYVPAVEGEEPPIIPHIFSFDNIQFRFFEDHMYVNDGSHNDNQMCDECIQTNKTLYHVFILVKEIV